MNRALVLGVLLVSCSPNVKSVSIEPLVVTFDSRGATVRLTATPRDEQGRPVAATKLKASWTSSAPLVATVDETGKVTALRSGDATIVAQVGEARGSSKVSVSVPTNVTVAPSALTLHSGQRTLLAAVVTDDAGRPIASPRVDWRCADPTVAKVVGDGQLTGVAPGTTLVTASVGPARGEARVTVAVPDFARLAVKPPRIALGKRGAKARILATALDQRGKPVAGVPVTWRSSNERVVRVAPDGTLTAVRRGKATVIATGGARSAAVRVTVRR